MPRKDKALAIIEKALDDHKAKDIVSIDVSERTPFAEYYVLATAGNKRQLNALKDAVVEELEKAKYSVGHIEGTPESGWVLIDCHHIIVNVFTEEERARINLEMLLQKHQ